MEERQFDLAAASLRADASDARGLAEVLAAKLGEALPDQTTVRRRGGRFRAKDRRLEGLEVQLGEDTFALTLAGERAQTSRARTVRGVVIKRQELPLDVWLEALSEALSAEAQRSESARRSLERLLG
jgi:hypothetical protein